MLLVRQPKSPKFRPFPICVVPQVANYCVTKLAELNVPLSTHAVGLTPDTQLPPANGHQFLELTCNGLVSAGTYLGLCVMSRLRLGSVCSVRLRDGVMVLQSASLSVAQHLYQLEATGSIGRPQ